MLREVGVPVTFVESEKSALAGVAAAQRDARRMLFVATGGCFGWLESRDEGPSTPLSDFNYFAWERRAVTIAFDGNGKENPDVRTALTPAGDAFIRPGCIGKNRQFERTQSKQPRRHIYEFE
jgi:hypothetical protein